MLFDVSNRIFVHYESLLIISFGMEQIGGGY